MLKTIILKIGSILLISFTFWPCIAYGNGTQENQRLSYKSDAETQKSLEGDGKITVIPLNNEATPFAEYLYVGSMYAGHRVFYDKDKGGAYHNWKTAQDFFSIPSSANVDSVFRYGNKVVCQYRKENKDSIIALYNEDLNLLKTGEIEGIFSPEYIYGNLCYGYSFTSDDITILSINLDTMEVNKIYSSYSNDNINVMISNNGEIIIYRYSPGNKNCYYRYKESILTPILETKSSSPVCCDARGLFYLEATNFESTMNLKLWNGQNSQIIAPIKIDDMNEWLFANGISGNVIIDDKFIVTIHQGAEEPYVLIQQIGKQRSEKVSLTKWKFSESDRETLSETFSGIYYEDGKIVNYFFSLKAGLLQMQTIDMNEILKRWED